MTDEEMATFLGLTPEEESAVAWQRRNIGKDGKPWSGWYLSDDGPSQENCAWDGVFSYEYRPLYPGDPIKL